MLELQDVISLLIALVAVMISMATLQQNRNMVEESTRPYITLTFDSITTSSQRSGFILKNYGRTSAIIDKFIVDDILLSHPQRYDGLNKQFDLMEGTIFAPGQSVFLPYSVSGIEKSVVTFELAYSSEFKSYHSNFSFNVSNMSHRYTTRTNEYSNGDTHEIAQCLHEIIERQL